MTLIVARIEKGRIAIAADTILSAHGAPLPIQAWLLKSICLQAFAARGGHTDVIGLLFDRGASGGRQRRDAVLAREAEAFSSGVSPGARVRCSLAKRSI